MKVFAEHRGDIGVSAEKYAESPANLAGRQAAQCLGQLPQSPQMSNKKQNPQLDGSGEG